MIRSICLLVFALGLSTAAQAEGYDYCGWEVQALAQRMGGDQVTMTYSSVNGWGVNAYGYASYKFVRGNEICGVSYTVFGTYFGMKCSESYGGVYCSTPGKRRRR